MKRIAVTLLVLAALMSLGAGARYLLLNEFMPYHATVSGKAWSSLDPGLQTIILGMLKIVGGGFLATGVALLFFAWACFHAASWSPWAAAAVLLAQWAPTLNVCLMLKAANPAAEPPIIPSALILVVGAAGCLCAWLAARGTPHRTEREPGRA